MFAEELAKIQESEKKAEEILKGARLEAKQCLADARAEAAKLVEEAKARGKDAYDGFLTEGQTEADRQYDEFLAKTRADCQAAVDAALKKQDIAIDYIAERIVGASVHR